nr:hypothetical protein [uncultured Helicobacter sp.]
MQIIPYSTFQTLLIHSTHLSQNTQINALHDISRTRQTPTPKPKNAESHFCIFSHKNPKSLQIIPQSTQNKSF